MKILLFLMTIAFVTTGCALRYMDGDNNETIVGCVWIKQKVDDPVITQLKTLGVSVGVGKDNNGLSVGYTNTIKVAPAKEDAFYDIEYNSSEPFLSKLNTLIVGEYLH